jgi:Zn-dependent peptidase ImmA (M78 family)/transcriptional regulator with XRE-family HTH domain
VAQRVEALVDPELLVWAREKARYDQSTAAKRARVSPERLAAWEAGEARPTVKQLRRLGRAYGRPLAVFYLAEPPRDAATLRDYRRVWGDEPRVLSPQLAKEIEIARDRRNTALELLDLEGGAPIRFRLRASLDEDPEAVAARVRRGLGIPLEKQLAWSDRYAGFNAWRDAIEESGALVLQMIDVPNVEARGFSISDRPLPAVVANIHDTPRARSFTLIHELIHIALERSGVCDLDDHGQTEVFCNHVAGAVLVPADALLREAVARTHDVAVEWADREIEALARRFSVSREVVVRRLLILGRTDEAFYRRKREQWADEYRAAEERRRQESEGEPRPIPQDLIAVARAGQFFSLLILSSYSHGLITASDVADYFGIRIKHLAAIERRVFGAPPTPQRRE